MQPPTISVPCYASAMLPTTSAQNRGSGTGMARDRMTRTPDQGTEQCVAHEAQPHKSAMRFSEQMQRYETECSSASDAVMPVAAAGMFIPGGRAGRICAGHSRAMKRMSLLVVLSPAAAC